MSICWTKAIGLQTPLVRKNIARVRLRNPEATPADLRPARWRGRDTWSVDWSRGVCVFTCWRRTHGDDRAPERSKPSEHHPVASRWTSAPVRPEWTWSASCRRLSRCFASGCRAIR
jgi:hypothetical protein